MLSNRQRQIIQLLLNSKETYSSEWIAKELGVSVRTIRNDIKQIQSEQDQHGYNLKSILGKGYKLEVENHKLNYNNINNCAVIKGGQLNFSEQKTRVYYLLERFLLEKNYLKLEDLEDEMFVSKSTIQKDLKEVRKLLEKYKLEIGNRPHYGLYLKGTELNKRLCLSNYLLHSDTNNQIGDTPFSIDKGFLNKIKVIIINKINQYKITISDISLENLVTHIAIACKRIEKNFIMEELNHHLDKNYPFESIVANAIVKDILYYIGIKFPKSEIDYIIIHLVGTKLLTKEELMSYSNKDETKEIIDNILTRLKEKLNWDLYDDFEFIQALTLHIRPAINRLKYGLNIRNPLLEEIKKNYPTAFEGAVIAGKCIEKVLNKKIGENEIGYIALHIGIALERSKEKDRHIKRVLVVCASGIGSAKLLSYRLQNNFGNLIKIVDTASFYQLTDYNFSNIDLIISTIPIKTELEIPVLMVNNFLSVEDIDNIHDYLAFGKPREEQSYIDPSRIFLNLDLKERNSVLNFLCKQLYKQGLIPVNYIQSVLEREKLAPTSFGNLVAIPHPLYPMTEDTFWTICTLKQPIMWSDNQPVQLICLLNVKNGAKSTLERMYDKLIKITENKSIVQKIIRSKSKDEIIYIMQSL